MRLRPELANDHEAVRQAHRQAFGIDGSKVAALVDSLRSLLALHPGVSLVADCAGSVVGHTMSTRSLLDAPQRLVSVQVLSPVGVLPRHQSCGVGGALVRRALELLDASGAPLVFLEGDPGYYARFGFEPAGQYGFRKPSLRIPDAAFQVARLASYEPWMTGTLVYDQTFWNHDSVGLRDTGTSSDPTSSIPAATSGC